MSRDTGCYSGKCRSDMETVVTNRSVPVVDKTKKLGNLRCGKEIISITEVDNEIIVMYSDCTFSTAPIDIEGYVGGKKIVRILEVKDKLAIHYDNGTYEEIDSKLFEPMEGDSSPTYETVPVEDIEGNTLFSGIAVEYKGGH